MRGVGIDFVVLDEAAFMPQEVWTACIRPALTDRNGGALIISTPAGRNWFFHVFQHGVDPLAEDWQSWNFPTAHNPRIDPGEIADALAITPKRQFSEEYQAKFIEGSGTVFRDIKEAATAAYRGGPQPGHTYVMGVDFGRYQDFTALVVIDSTEQAVACVDRFNEENWGTQRNRIAALAKRWNVTSILAEANAMGEPNIEALWNQGLPIQSFTTTPHNKPNLIEMLSAAIENRELRLLPDPVLMAELEAYTQRERKSGGYTIYAAPTGVHDDTVIALALAWRLTATPRLTLRNRRSMNHIAHSQRISVYSVSPWFNLLLFSAPLCVLCGEMSLLFAFAISYMPYAIRHSEHPMHPHPAHHRTLHGRISDLHRVDAVDVSPQHHQVGEESGGKLPQSGLRAARVGRPAREPAHRLVHAQAAPLARSPAIRPRRAIQSAARHCRLDVGQRLNRLNRRIRAKGHRRARIHLEPPVVRIVGAAAPVGIRHQHVAGGMVGLHRGDHAQLAQPPGIFRGDDLDVLNAVAHLGRAHTPRAASSRRTASYTFSTW